MSGWIGISARPVAAIWCRSSIATATCWCRIRRSRRTPRQYYDRVIELDLSRLEPHVVGPHTPDRARPMSRLAAEIADPANGFADSISTALIGSCTNSSYEDMSRAADVAEQLRRHGLDAAVPLLVTPGSERVRATIERDGQMQALAGIGATVLANACGPCIGQWRRASEATEAPNTIVTSYNRNFPRRNDGQRDDDELHCQPGAGHRACGSRAAVIQSADRHVDWRRRRGVPARSRRSRRLRCPRRISCAARSAYVAPPADGTGIALEIDPDSERLQRLEPWPAWDGRDFADMPVLLKTTGKTTTDHISPAGPWLRFRGHLDRFSDNMFIGAIECLHRRDR